MTKHARKSRRYQPVERPPAATVQIPLPVLGAFAGIARSSVELCIRAGQQVLDAMMEQDRTELCGPRWKRDPERRAGRAGTTSSAVTVGGRRSRMTRPRVRSQTREEVEVPSVACASHRDPLDAQTVNAVACGISTRTYARSLEPLPEEVTERATSKSAVSRRDVALTTTQLTRWLTTPLGDRQFPIVLIDGIVRGDHTVVIALGVDPEGKTQSLGLREGHTEQSRVANALLRDLVDRGLVPDRARLVVIDGARLGPPRGVWPARGHPALSAPQTAQHAGPSPGAAARACDRGAAGRVGGRCCRPGATITGAAGRFPRDRPSGGRRLGARGPRRHPHAATLRHGRGVIHDVAHHERHRELQWQHDHKDGEDSCCGPTGFQIGMRTGTLYTPS